MAVIQKHGKNYGPDLVCHKENHPADKIGVPGCHKKWAEHNNNNWPRPVARVWTVVLLLGTCLLYCARVAMPICAVSMAEKFNWSKKESGMVLGSFFWGYCFTQVFGGYVSDRLKFMPSSLCVHRVGGEKVLLLSAAAWGSMTAFTPILAHFCSQPIFSMTLARFLMGLLQGVHYPSLASLCSQKVVESERGFLMSTVGSGSYLGTLVIGGAGSLMLDLYGWESVFYVSGLLAVMWAYCMWKYLLKGEGPIITLESLGSGGPQSKVTKRHWLRLFKQPAVCAVIITHLCTASTFFTLLSWLPTFFKDTFPDAKGWVFNVIPWLVAIPSSLFSGYLSDHLISKGFDTTSVRKLMQFFSMGISSVFTLLLCGNTTFPWATAFVSATMGLTTFSHSGVSVNVQDLAPSCAGALFGVMNTCGAFSVVLACVCHVYFITKASRRPPQLNNGGPRMTDSRHSCEGVAMNC
ncbi:solute carrier family 17 member 9b isoform X3 [Phyllopteryx taeniolatus]|uniref:solute carrier family 17 member 9b isoform X3 n=1 Tax=Phyllopteryx taeniolatus TaxID=161469 RepID=UPI002AD57AA6|nr:solute carrier family 17 member 9b isoform X3 [Phyllopteryx taeniolatus]